MSVCKVRGPAAAVRVDRTARDLALVAAYRRGRVDAFDELVAAYDLHVRRILGQLNAPASETEDLTQEVFLRIFRNLGHFRGQSSFYTWLYRITLNVFFDHSKKRKRADVRLARLVDSVRDASYAPVRSGDPYAACRDAFVRGELERAIDELPFAFRDVVAMREMRDYSYEEIASATGVSVGTVRSRLSRARSRLRALLQTVVDAPA